MKFTVTYQLDPGWIINGVIEADSLDDAVWEACDRLNEYLYCSMWTHLHSRLSQSRRKEDS